MGKHNKAARNQYLKRRRSRLKSNATSTSEEDKSETDTTEAPSSVNSQDGHQELDQRSQTGCLDLNDPALDRLFRPMKAKHDPLWLSFERFHHNKRKLINLLRNPLGD